MIWYDLHLPKGPRQAFPIRAKGILKYIFQSIHRIMVLNEKIMKATVELPDIHHWQAGGYQNGRSILA